MAAKNEGMSTSKKVIAGAAVGVALPASVGAAKKLMGGEEEPKPRRRPMRRSSTKSRSTAKSRAKRNSSASPTREQLYKTAKRLKIAGRSSMSKSQLQRAVSRAKSR